MTLKQAIDRYTNNAEYERIHGSLQGCMEFRQLAEWLKDYKRLLEQEPCDDAISRDAALEKMADYVASGCADSAEDFEEYSRIICQLPSVTQTPKYWIDKDNKLYKMPDDIPITFEPLEQMINALPSVTQKSGKWIGIDEEPHEDYECSCCGYVVSTFTANIEPHTEYKYCPNCGAKMESEVNNG